MYKASSFIGGQEIVSDKLIEVKSPIDGKVVGTVPVLNKQHIDDAFSKAKEAFVKWSQVDYKTRIKFVLAFAAKLRECAAVISQIIHLETGKSLKGAHDEVMRSYEYIVESSHAYADMMDRPEEYNYDNNILMPKDIAATYVRVPLGVAFTVSPFNYPVNLMISKIAPAIIVGNSVVHKSATNGSISCWYVAKLFHEVSVDGYLITPGVFNYITGRGSELGSFIDENSEIDSFSFTGSSEVGKQLLSKLRTGIPVQLEMGGHNPAIVMSDADLDLAVQEISKGAFSFSGQRCTSIKRVLVHKKVHDAFVEKMKKHMETLNLEEPLIDERSVNRLKEFCQDALDKGANQISPDLSIKGNYVTPVVFTNVKKGMKLFDSEVFGPVLAISKYEQEAEIEEFCNNSKYGLQASIFSEDLDVASSEALKLEFGRVNVNLCPARSPDILPFGGVKDSGLGFQSIGESLKFFTRYKGVVLRRLYERQ